MAKKNCYEPGVGMVTYTNNSVAMKSITSIHRTSPEGSMKKNDFVGVMQQKVRPKVGVGVFVLSDSHPGCVLLGKRKGSSGEGKYGLPGGHMEFGEDWVECGEREVHEETGLQLTDVRFSAVLNVVIPEENYHYVEFFVQGYVDIQHREEPLNLEPEKCEGWEWVSWNNVLPSDGIFEPLKQLIEQGYNPFT